MLHAFASRALINWRLLFLTLPAVGVALAVRGGMAAAGVEVYAAASITAPVITASVFVAAQRRAGVLSDWKESERAPSQLEASLSSVLSAALVAAARAGRSPAPALAHIDAMLTAIVAYLDTALPFTALSRALVDAEVGVCANVQAWRGDVRTIQLPMTHAREVLARMEQISVTSFVSVAYSLHDLCAACVILCVGATNYDSLAMSLSMLAFFTGLFVYLSLLLRDLDSPFTYPPGFNRRCREALAVVPRGLSETHASAVDMGLVVVAFAAELAERRRAAGRAGPSAATPLAKQGREVYAPGTGGGGEPGEV